MKIKMKNSTAVLLIYAIATLILLVVMIFVAKIKVDKKMDELRKNQNSQKSIRHFH